MSINPKRVRGQSGQYTVVPGTWRITGPAGVYVDTDDPTRYNCFRFDDGVFDIIGGALVEIDSVTGRPLSALSPSPAPDDARDRVLAEVIAAVEALRR